MNDPQPNPGFLAARGVPAQRAMQSAFLWVLASLGTAVAIFAIALCVNARSVHEAGRMSVEAQTGKGYLHALATAGVARGGVPGF